MKKLFALILTFLCLLTTLSIPAFAADADVEPYGTPGSGYDQKTFTANGVQYSASSICSSIARMWLGANARRLRRQLSSIVH